MENNQCGSKIMQKKLQFNFYNAHIFYFIFKKDISAQPKGSLIIRNIKEIKDGKKNQFGIVYLDRVFELQCETTEQKKTWINTLEILQNYQNLEFEEINNPEFCKEQAKNLQTQQNSVPRKSASNDSFKFNFAYSS